MYQGKIDEQVEYLFEQIQIEGKVPKEFGNQNVTPVDTNILGAKARQNGEEKNFYQSEGNREKVQDNPKYPYSAIGYVSGKFEDKFFYGTGCLIASNIVLTCAHNVYDRNSKEQAIDLQFTPGLNGKLGTVAGSNVVKVSYPKQFKQYTQGNETLHQQYDYALLIVDKKYENTCGYLGIDAKEENVDGDIEVELCGYPSDKQHSDDEKTMFKVSDFCEEIGCDFLMYKMPTERGQSGSPVFKMQGDKYYVVGVHTRSQSSRKLNVAVRLNAKIHKNINQLTTRRLRSLDLESEKLGVDILKMPPSDFQNINILKLQNNNLSFIVMEELSKRNWENLYVLDISENNISDKGLEYINAPNLQKLIAIDCGLSARGIKQFFTHDFKLKWLKEVEFGDSFNEEQQEQIVKSVKGMGITVIFD